MNTNPCCEKCEGKRFTNVCRHIGCKCHTPTETVQHTEESWEKEFDEKFGVGEGTAGCDGCDSNMELRAEHKEFVRSLLLSQKKEWELELQQKRGEIEKLIWKHYHPFSALNTEELVDDILQILS